MRRRLVQQRGQQKQQQLRDKSTPEKVGRKAERDAVPPRPYRAFFEEKLNFPDARPPLN